MLKPVLLKLLKPFAELKLPDESSARRRLEESDRSLRSRKSPLRRSEGKTLSVDAKKRIDKWRALKKLPPFDLGR
jgi:hypothetical protein